MAYQVGWRFAGFGGVGGSRWTCGPCGGWRYLADVVSADEGGCLFSGTGATGAIAPVR